MQIQGIQSCAVFLVVLGVVCLVPGQAGAHCDSLDGPAVQDARLALETGDPMPVLKWASKEYEIAKPRHELSLV